MQAKLKVHGSVLAQKAGCLLLRNWSCLHQPPHRPC